MTIGLEIIKRNLLHEAPKQVTKAPKLKKISAGTHTSSFVPAIRFRKLSAFSHAFKAKTSILHVQKRDGKDE